MVRHRQPLGSRSVAGLAAHRYRHPITWFLNYLCTCDYPSNRLTDSHDGVCQDTRGLVNLHLPLYVACPDSHHWLRSRHTPLLSSPPHIDIQPLNPCPCSAALAASNLCGPTSPTPWLLEPYGDRLAENRVPLLLTLCVTVPAPVANLTLFKLITRACPSYSATRNPGCASFFKALLRLRWDFGDLIGANPIARALYLKAIECHLCAKPPDYFCLLFGSSRR